MAERTVNVNINYKVNTADVEKAKQASIAAQKATDDLRKSTQAYEQQVKQAGKTAHDSMKQTQASVAGVYQGMNDLFSAVRAVVTAGILRWAVDTTLEMARLSGTIEGVSKAFSRLPNATLLMNDLRKATHGTVTDLELMQKALMASNFRIPLEKLGTLLEFAAVKAQQTGQEVNHLVEYIVSGIGYRSIKRLDDLGFTANRVKEALGGVSIQAASMGELMNAVTKLMNEDLQKTGGFAETAATKVEQLETKWAKLKASMSAALTSPAVLSFYEAWLDRAERAVDFIRGVDPNERNAQKEGGVNAQQFIERELTKEILKDRQKSFDLVQQEINSQQQRIGRNNDELKQLRERFQLITTIEGRKELWEEEKKALDLNNKTRKERLKASHDFKEALDKEEGTIKQMARGLSFKNTQLKESIKILKEYLKTFDQTATTEKPEGEDNERGSIMKPLTQTVDIRFKDPKTGQITKEHEAKVLNDILGPMFEDFQDYLDNNPLIVPVASEPVQEIRRMDNWDKFSEDWKNQWRDVLAQGFSDTANYLISTEQAQVESLQRQLQSLKNYYDHQQLLAGDNEEAKKQLRIKEEKETAEFQKRIAEQEWKARRNAVLYDTAAGIARNIATYPYPGWIIPVAVTAAQGALQLAAVEKAKPRFAEGVINLKGPGTETSDSIDAKLSRGESVITAKATKNSTELLKMIQANEIDDRILKAIDFSGGRYQFSDERIVKAIQGQKFPKAPDLVRQGRNIYEVHEDRKNHKRYIRSRSI